MRVTLDESDWIEPTFKYALTCFLAPITQGNNLVLSPTAIKSKPPASASSSACVWTEEGVEGRDLMRWRRVEKWDKTRRVKEVGFGVLGGDILLIPSVSEDPHQ